MTALQTAALVRTLVLLVMGALLAACGQFATKKPAAQVKQVSQVKQDVRPSVVCSARQGNPFAMRKKVLLLSLPALSPNEAADLPGIESAWSRALQQRLQGSDHLLLRDGSSYTLDPGGDVREQVLALARKFDAQIVIAGQISSLGVRPDRIGLGPLGSLPQPFSERRGIVTELDVYDGDTGARLARLEHQGEARGAVHNEGSPMQGGFFATPLGVALAKILEQQSAAIEDELACLPLQATIVHTVGDEARMNAGYTSHIRAGDILRVIQRQGFPGKAGEQIEKTYGNLVIKQVFPESALGQFQGKEPPDWRYSVFVRAW